MQRFGQMHSGKGVAAAAWARALFIEHNLEPLSEESSSTPCCILATFGWVLSDRPTCHHLESWRYISGCTRLWNPRHR